MINFQVQCARCGGRLRGSMPRIRQERQRAQRCGKAWRGMVRRRRPWQAEPAAYGSVLRACSHRQGIRQAGAAHQCGTGAVRKGGAVCGIRGAAQRDIESIFTPVDHRQAPTSPFTEYDSRLDRRHYFTAVPQHAFVVCCVREHDE